MDISFHGKFKSITSFNWLDVPSFVVITGPNGTGKSQLLELIYGTIVNTQNFSQRVSFAGKIIMPEEVIFLKGEWQLENTVNINLSTIQQQLDGHYNNFKRGDLNRSREGAIHLVAACQEIVKKTGKDFNFITKEEFYKLFPEILIEHQNQISTQIGQIFYNYRLSEIEIQAKKRTESEITKEIGEKPWQVLREIIKEAKLPFEINDPSSSGIRDGFQLRITHQILKEEINFTDLSSGEKVLISLVLYLYNAQEKKIFPKLLLLDEPDAHLHPSMSHQFLNVVKNVLADKFGVQVMMTTHSPSTVILASTGSIYEMSRSEPKIQKAASKNHSVSLLTAGLVYVGEGTKYFLVEDNDDVTFYSFVYNQLTSENKINADIPLVFIPASTKDKSGGKDVVQNWVNKLQESGLVGIIQGLIDADSGNTVSDGVFKIDRYSIENYLIDPIVVYAALIDNEKNPAFGDLKLSVGEEYKLKLLPRETLQKIADMIVDRVEKELKMYFPDFDEKEKKIIQVEFLDGIVLNYPKWLFHRRGKTIINEVYNKVYTSKVINFSSLFKAFRKLNMIPKDLIVKLNEIKS